MKIGILTGGGDVPGLNACIKAATLRATEEAIRSSGSAEDGAGSSNAIPTTLPPWSPTSSTSTRRPSARSTGAAERSCTPHGRTPRGSDPPRSPNSCARRSDGPADHTPHVLGVLDRLGIEALIPIGGDDTLSFALRLHEEGVPVVAIPKTMDNDVHGTDYCIGFSTAITRTVIFIHQLRTSAGSHERLAVVEVFGRYSGETSLVSAYLSGVERAVISEVPFDVEKLATKLLQDKRANPSGYAMMTISEGATMVGGETVHAGMADAYGHLKLGGVGQVTGEALREITGEGIIYQQVGYLMRSGSPDSLDLMVAINYAVMAADLVIERQFGRLVALRNGNYTNVPLPVVRQGVKRVDVGALYDVEAYRPKIRHVDGKPMFLY